MAQTTYIAATGNSATSATITLAAGETISVHATEELTGSERVVLLQSSDDGSSFRALTGAINNNGTVLDQYINRNTVTGPGIFQLQKTITSASIAVKGG